MTAQTVHVVHDTYGGMVRRQGRKFAYLLFFLAIFLLLGFFGAVTEGDFKSAFWILIAGIIAVAIGIAIERLYRRPEDGFRIHFY